MKLRNLFLLTASLAVAGLAHAEKIHQQLEGEAAFSGDGKNAVEVKKVETKEVGGDTVARVTGGMSQWGYVNYWLGIPTPAGSAIIRLRILPSEEPTARYALYVGKKGPIAIPMPDDAKAGEFVDVDVPIEMEDEWNAIVLKKTTKDDLPGPWIDSIKVLLAD